MRNRMLVLKGGEGKEQSRMTSVSYLVDFFRIEAIILDVKKKANPGCK